LDAVEPEVFESELEHEDECFGDQPAPGLRLINPIADVRALKRPTVDRVDVDLASEPAIDEQPEPVPRTHLNFSSPRRTASGKRLHVMGDVG
jgi:hypothetical protein